MQRRRFLNWMGGSALSPLLWPLPRNGESTAGWHGEVEQGNPDGPVDPFWRQVRSAFPLQSTRAYFNTGGLGVAPYPVLQAVQETMMRQHTVGETGHEIFEAAHQPVADFLGCQRDDLAFCRNATEANSMIAFGLRLQPGDEVILDTEAHPGGGTAWLALCAETGIRVRLFRPSANSVEENLAAIREQFSPRTRVLQVSHVTAPRGIHMPVREIGEWARTQGVWFHIDGAQSAGMFPFRVEELGGDSWSTSGH